MISFDSLYWLVKQRVRILEGFSVKLVGATNANPIVITSESSHQYQNGQMIKIEEVKGNKAANGSYLVKVLTPTKFELYSQLNGVSNASNSIPILLTLVGHNFRTADKITVLGVEGNTGANGVFYVKQSGKAISNVVGTPVLNIFTFANTNPVYVTVVNHGLTTGDQVDLFTPSLAASISGRYYINALTVNDFEIYSRSINISNASNTSPIVITAAGHNVTTIQKVNVINVLGNTAANSTYYANPLNDSQFELWLDSALTAPSVGNGVYIVSTLNSVMVQPADGTVLGAYEGLGTMQKYAPIVVTAVNHGFANKAIVKILDVVGEPSALSAFYIKLTGSNTFELYSDSALSIPVISTGTYVSGGIAALLDNYDLELYLDNQLTLFSSGTGSYTRNGYVFSIPVVGSGDYIEGGVVKKDFIIENEFKDTFPGIPSNIYESIVKRIRS